MRIYINLVHFETLSYYQQGASTTSREQDAPTTFKNYASQIDVVYKVYLYLTSIGSAIVIMNYLLSPSPNLDSIVITTTN